jgi:outer membrane protein insertion porin family
MKKQFNGFRLRTVSALVAMAFVANTAWAVEPFQLRDIRVEGLQRTDPGTVFASLPFRIGDQYTDEKGAAAIRALFALGLFKDVRMEITAARAGGARRGAPHIATSSFAGAKEFDKDASRRRCATSA